MASRNRTALVFDHRGIAVDPPRAEQMGAMEEGALSQADAAGVFELKSAGMEQARAAVTNMAMYRAR